MKTIGQRTVIAGRYRVLRELGRGGMGAVFEAEHVNTGDHVALKVLLGHAATDPHAIERFKREARASAKIKSEHVVKVIDADVAPELDGVPFIVMELLDGGDLDSVLGKRGRLPPAEVIALLAQAARALDKSHRLGIIHRDLKPENLFLHTREDGSQVLKIVDFGISKIIEGDTPESGRPGLTNSGTMVGTPFYMSPEQAKGHVSDIAATTDVWAVGLIAIKLLTNENYWTARSVAEVMVQILSDPMPKPSSRWPWLPKAIDDWFARSCARDAKGRFASVGEQVGALAQAFGLPLDPSASPRTPGRSDAPAVVVRDQRLGGDAAPDSLSAAPTLEATPEQAARADSALAKSVDTKAARPSRGRRAAAAAAILAASAFVSWLLLTKLVRVEASEPSAPIASGTAAANQSAAAPSAPADPSATEPAASATAASTDAAAAASASTRSPAAAAAPPATTAAAAATTSKPPASSAPAPATASTNARDYAPTTL